MIKSINLPLVSLIISGMGLRRIETLRSGRDVSMRGTLGDGDLVLAWLIVCQTQISGSIVEIRKKKGIKNRFLNCWPYP